VGLQLWGALACGFLACLGCLMILGALNHTALLTPLLVFAYFAHGAVTTVIAVAALAHRIRPVSCLQSAFGCCRFFSGWGCFFGLAGVQALSILGVLQSIDTDATANGSVNALAILSIVLQFSSSVIHWYCSACSPMEDGYDDNRDVEIASVRRQEHWCCRQVAGNAECFFGIVAVVTYFCLVFLGCLTASLPFSYPGKFPVTMAMYFVIHGALTVLCAIGSLMHSMYKIEFVDANFGVVNSLMCRGCLFVFFGASELLSLGSFFSESHSPVEENAMMLLAIAALTIVCCSGFGSSCFAAVRYPAQRSFSWTNDAGA